MILLTLIVLPDVNGLVSDDTLGWKLWDALTHFRTSALCVAGLYFPRTYGVRLCLWLTAGWFMGQAADEWWWNDTFTAGLWEYGFLALAIAITSIHLYHHDRNGAKGA